MCAGGPRALAEGWHGSPLAATTGMASPRQVGALCQAFFDSYRDVPLTLHFHNTRGMGLANVLAALDAGANSFDASLGGIGGTHFTPIINAPEVAILGLSRSAMKPVWDGKQFVPRLLMPLSLSYDHRVIDGASAARFNAYLGQVLADFRRVLL